MTKIKLGGSIPYFWFINVGFIILDTITLGLMIPVHVYWEIQYILENLEIYESKNKN